MYYLPIFVYDYRDYGMQIKIPIVINIFYSQKDSPNVSDNCFIKNL